MDKTHVAIVVLLPLMSPTTMAAVPPAMITASTTNDHSCSATNGNASSTTNDSHDNTTNNGHDNTS